MPDPRMTQRFAIMEEVKAAAKQIFGDDHQADIAKVTSHALDTRDLSVGETLLLGKFLVAAAEHTMDQRA